MSNYTHVSEANFSLLSSQICFIRIASQCTEMEIYLMRLMQPVIRMISVSKEQISHKYYMI